MQTSLSVLIIHNDDDILKGVAIRLATKFDPNEYWKIPGNAYKESDFAQYWSTDEIMDLSKNNTRPIAWGIAAECDEIFIELVRRFKSNGLQNDLFFAYWLGIDLPTWKRFSVACDIRILEDMDITKDPMEGLLEGYNLSPRPIYSKETLEQLHRQVLG